GTRARGQARADSAGPATAGARRRGRRARTGGIEVRRKGKGTPAARAGRKDAATVKVKKVKEAGPPFIVLTGLSGSGKSQAIRALEDLGYFCVDNLPTTLIPTLAKLSLRAGGDIEKVAIVVDIREGGFLSSFPKVFRKLQKMPALNPVLIF